MESTNTSPKTALYARGSCPAQTAAQLHGLRQHAQTLGLNVVGEFVDVSTPMGKHPELERLMSNIRQGQVGVLMIASLDRLGLTIKQTVVLLAELASRGVHLVAVGEGIDTTTEAGQATLKGITALAVADKALARERGKASVASARRGGSRIGRPPAEIDVARAVELRAQGMSYRKIALKLGGGMGVATVHRALAKVTQ